MAVTEYVYQLHEKERMLEELVKELKGLLRKRHICDIIRENQSIQKKIEEALSLTPGECDKLREMAVSQIGRFNIFLSLTSADQMKEQLRFLVQSTSSIILF